RMAMNWAGAEGVLCPVLSVHGDRDVIIPPSCAEPGIVLKDAGHAFTLTHAEETNSAIKGFLGALASQTSVDLV
ncbi:MAG: alpha/beta hydrolase, partial [Elusimicrobiota bacterium]